MSDKFFLDTNIFVYTFDSQAPNKQKQAHQLVQQALQSGDGIISTQVVQEFLNVALRKFATPLNLDDSKTYLRRVLYPLCQIYPGLSLYESCLDIQARTGYSFYDSLIVAAAIAGRCQILFSEDLHHSHVIEGVTIQNPFLTETPSE